MLEIPLTVCGQILPAKFILRMQMREIVIIQCLNCELDPASCMLKEKVFHENTKENSI